MLDAAVARRLKLVGFDVDGVLTDNGIYVGMVGDHPVEFKRFHIQDGLGVRLLRTAGLLVVWLSGRESTATMLRAGAACWCSRPMRSVGSPSAWAPPSRPPCGCSRRPQAG